MVEVYNHACAHGSVFDSFDPIAVHFIPTYVYAWSSYCVDSEFRMVLGTIGIHIIVLNDCIAACTMYKNN